MDDETKKALGSAIWTRARLLGYSSQEALAATAGIGRRTIGPLIGGVSPFKPSPRILNALDQALACPRGTLISAFQKGDPDIIRNQPLAGTDDPASWIVQRLSIQGAATDPEWIARLAGRLAPALPDAARILTVVAQITAEACGSDPALAQITAENGSDWDLVSFAARTQRRHLPEQQILAEAAG